MEAPMHLQHVIVVSFNGVATNFCYVLITFSSFFAQLTSFLGNAVVSFLFAFILSMMFEAPVIRLLKICFKK